MGYNNQPSAYGQQNWRPQNFPPAQNMQNPPNQQFSQNSQQQFGGSESLGRGGFVLGGPGGLGTDVAAGFGNGGMDRMGGGDGYRDRAAERRGLYGGPPVMSRNNGGGENGGYARQGAVPEDEPPVAFERVDQSRALGDTNVGNRMLRNMGWQEGQVRSLNLAVPTLGFMLGDMNCTLRSLVGLFGCRSAGIWLMLLHFVSIGQTFS